MRIRACIFSPLVQAHIDSVRKRHQCGDEGGAAGSPGGSGAGGGGSRRCRPPVCGPPRRPGVLHEGHGGGADHPRGEADPHSSSAGSPGGQVSRRGS